MSEKRFFFSCAWAIATFIGVFIAGAPLFENYYAAKYPAGDDLRPLFTFYYACAALSLVVLVVGLFGKLPLTK